MSTIFRLIPAKWTEGLKVLEGQFDADEIFGLNELGYNVYYLCNHPDKYDPTKTVDGADIDVFNYIFVDYDIKSNRYASKEEFVETLFACGIEPSKIVDSGNGIHAYWRITNLDAKSYLRFQRRIMRLLRTDEATTNLYQLMRYPGTMNTKAKDGFLPCILLYESEASYTAEEMDKLLPNITKEDEQHCEDHYNRTLGINQDDTEINEALPPKFGKFLRDVPEAKALFSGEVSDRSKADYRLAHLMFANGFSRDEALSVLVNSAKAVARAPIHRRNYAINIVDKIWTFETAEAKDGLTLSNSVKDILQRSGSTLKGTRFRCHPRIDNTHHGFRLGQVIGLVAGSGVGKTAFALNMFRWFSQENPDYHHFFVPLEQPANEIADRWNTMCGTDHSLHEKVHIISNYDEAGNFRHLSLDDIQEYIKKFQDVKKIKVGCVVIDHIGALKKNTRDGENQGLMDICHAMKAFAVQTNTLLVMQSQTNREKAGIGDLELNKDAAYGTIFFESYVDFLITMWQPLKRCHSQPACPTVTAFKYCKIRHKKTGQDVVQEDVPYFLYFDPTTERLEDMTEDQKTSFSYWLPQATNKRKADRKTEILNYQSVPYQKDEHEKE